MQNQSQAMFWGGLAHMLLCQNICTSIMRSTSLEMSGTCKSAINRNLMHCCIMNMKLGTIVRRANVMCLLYLLGMGNFLRKLFGIVDPHVGNV